jgi:ribosomal protein L29
MTIATHSVNHASYKTMTEELDSASQAVLQLISEDHDDIQKITSETTLTNSQVNYRFQKLEKLDLITVEKPDGWTTRTINGQTRKFKTPKQASLTELGEQRIQEEEIGPDEYRDLTHEELVEKVCELEAELYRLQSAVDVFQKQIQRQRE